MRWEGGRVGPCCRGGAARAGPGEARGGAYEAWPELAGGSLADVTPARRVLEHEP